MKKKKEINKNMKHLYWVIGLVLITTILCGTFTWMNSHAWTIRFEMDDDTHDAFKSIDWDVINNGNKECPNPTFKDYDHELNKWVFV